MSLPRFRLKTLVAAAILIASATATATLSLEAPMPAGAVVTRPEEIKWQECWGAPPGGSCAVMAGDHAKPGLFADRISLPSNYEMPAHIHPTDEQVIVLKGIYHAGFGDRLDRSKSVALPAGSFLLIPRGAAHFAWTDGPVVVQVYGEGPWGLIPVAKGQ